MQLGTTEEEEESHSGVSCSPPTESKIRQISQGVEDMTWKHIQKGGSLDRDLKMQAHDPEPTTEHHGAATTHGPNEEADARAYGAEAEPIKAEMAGGDKVPVPPVLLQGENPPQILDGAGEDEHSGQADPQEVPLATQPSDPAACNSPEVHSEPSAISAIPRVSASTPPSRHSPASEAEAEAEKGVKRKLRDRTVSERLIPGEVEEDGGAVAHKVAANKRQRDDSDADANPRVTKRPTPPPDEKVSNGRKTDQETEGSTHGGKKVATPSTSSTPKLVCASSLLNPLAEMHCNQGGFMAYASTSSPFASVSGSSLFNKTQSPPSSPFVSASTSFASAFASASPGTPSKSMTSAESPLPQKRTGFEAFASTSSPFASIAKRPRSPPPPAFGGSSLARSRSPSRHPTSARTGNTFSTSAFTVYATGGAQGFSTPKPQSERASPAPSEGSTRATSVFDSGNKDDADQDSRNGAVSFSERLRSQKDDEENEDSDKPKLTEQEGA